MSRSYSLTYWPAVAVALVIALFGARACLATSQRDNLAAATADARDPAATQAWSGSLMIARGGPSVIGFLSPGPARLAIGTREIVGRGLQTQWMVLPAGPVAIHFAAPPKARLMWSPVGRRGDPEYIPASSLSSLPPEQAEFSHPGTSLLDGAVAEGLLIVIVLSVLMLARHRLAGVSKQTWIAMGAIFALAVIARWIDLSGHGQTWDEDTNWAAGRNYITNIVSLDASPDLWSWNFEHPPVMKYLEGIGAQFADGFGPARAFSALWISLGCALLVPIGTRLFSLRVGFLAAVIAALLPPLVAHGQIVGHESPTVLWWTLGILVSLTAFDDEPTRRQLRIRFVALGVVIGIAIASRFTNGLLGTLCLAIIAVNSPPAEKQRWRPLIEAWLIMPVVALVTLYAIWPRLWPHPILFMQAAFTKLSQTHSTEPFLGAMTVNPGPHYFFVYLAATLPIGILVGVIAYIARAATAKERSAWIMLAWFLIPLGVALSPVRQDGVRYVMPSVVALAMCAAAGFDLIATKLKRGFPIIAAVVVGYLGITLVRVHPYYLDYFGEQVGGAGTVAQHGWMETAWWGEGVDRAVDYVNENAPVGAHVYRDCIEPKHLAWFRENLWIPMAHSIDQADWVVIYAPQTRHCAVPPTFQKVFSVDANGAVLAEVWKKP